MQIGAIILCGGESKRMGRDKATLPFGPHESMLQRVVRLVGEAVPASRIVCVAAPEQQLPSLPSGIMTARDAEPQRGPLAGLAVGLRALQGRADALFVTGCDVPLIVPAAISRMFELLGDYQIVAPHDGSRWHPLAAVYRTDVLPQVASLLATDERSLVALLETCHTRRAPIDDLRQFDASLDSLAACNTMEEYDAALRRAEFNNTPEASLPPQG